MSETTIKDTNNNVPNKQEECSDSEVEHLDTQASDAQEEIARLKNKLLRSAAEFENFKKRTREEKNALIKYGNEALLLDLLPIIDDFDRSLVAGREHPDFESFYQGIEIMFGKLLRVLEQRGLSLIDAKGKPFDVDFHDALLQVPSTDVDPGTVLDVIEKGYMLHDRVIRHAKVLVAIRPEDIEQTGGEG